MVRPLMTRVAPGGLLSAALPGLGHWHMHGDQQYSKWEALLARESTCLSHTYQESQENLQTTVESSVPDLEAVPNGESEEPEATAQESIEQPTVPVSAGDAFALFAAMDETNTDVPGNPSPVGMDAAEVVPAPINSAAANDIATPAPASEPLPIGVLQEGNEQPPTPPESNDEPFGSVTVLLGKGDGTFTQGPVTELPLSPGLGKLVDRLGDSRLGQLVSARWLRHGWPSLLHGRGLLNRLFLSVGRFGFLNHGATAADFTGDEKLDLAVFGHGRPLLLTGKGDGAFELTDRLGAGAKAAPLALGLFGLHHSHGPFGSTMPSATADFNKDGQPDLAFVLPGSEEVTLLVSQPGGSYSRSTAPLTLRDDAHVLLATGDFNNDGNTDIAVIQFVGHDHPKLDDLWERLLARFPILGTRVECSLIGGS